MKTVFKNFEVLEFENVFGTEEKCLEYLSKLKWESGFLCRKCGHNNYCKGRKQFSRRCTKCKTEESATAHTLFHKCKFPLHQAFRIAFKVCSSPNISTEILSEEINIRKMTCWKFKKKIQECINSRGSLEILEN